MFNFKAITERGKKQKTIERRIKILFFLFIKTITQKVDSRIIKSAITTIKYNQKTLVIIDKQAYNNNANLTHTTRLRKKIEAVDTKPGVVANAHNNKIINEYT